MQIESSLIFREAFGEDAETVDALGDLFTRAERWDDLVAHFAFSSFLAEIDLQTVRKRNRWIEARKSDGVPPGDA